MLDYSDYSIMINELEDTQSDEQFRREHSLEAHKFLEDRNGQWDPEIFNRMSGRPRMTYDKCTPIRNQIAGEMEQADFDIKVKPAGGDATKQLAKLRDGMIRNIENMSNAVEVFNHASRANVTAGIDGCRVVVKFQESDSFDKDLLIEPLANFINRVWFDRASEKQDRSDADFQWDIQAISRHVYNERWPKGTAVSVSTLMQRRDNQLDQVIIGEFLYKKPVDIDLVLMSDGKVYRAEQFEPVKDELAAQGITVSDTRTRKGHLVYSRFFDGNDWLENEVETIFEWLPIVPIYGNFRIDEDNKPVYFGAIEKLMDQQRSINYYASRDLEEVKNRIALMKVEQQEDLNLMKLDQQDFDQSMQTIQAQIDELSKNAQTLKTLREAMGVEQIVGPHNTDAYIHQAAIVTDNQDNFEQPLDIQHRDEL